MPAASIAADWRWSDKFIPAIRAIVGPYLLATAPLSVDRNQAADLIVLNGRNVTIACRVRRATYGAGFADQFTLRSSRPSGAKSEFEKIAEGFATLLFYGFADAEGTGIKEWSIIDLNAFRAHLIMNPSTIVSGERKNADGTAFRWYNLRSFPAKPPILIASSSDQERRIA